MTSDDISTSHDTAAGGGGRTRDDRLIVSALPTELFDRLQASILGRQDLSVRNFNDPKLAVELVHRRAPALLLLYDSGGDELAEIVPGIRRAVIASRFPVVVIAEFLPEIESDWVTEYIPADIETTELSTTIGRLLRLPVRAGRRHLIRVGFELDDPDSFSTTGNTVDISATGLLIECSKRLRVGFYYQMSILGVGNTPKLGIRVVREAEPRHPNLHRYGCTFEDVDPEIVESLIRRLAA